MDRIQLMNQTWNNFVNSPSEKVRFTLEEFLKKMKDEEYLRTAIKQIEVQDKICICQHLKKTVKKKGFVNFFLAKLQGTHKRKAGYYFIYKQSLSPSSLENYKFLPAVAEYKVEHIKIDSKTYLANFSIPMKATDYIYCIQDKVLMTYKEFVN